MLLILAVAAGLRLLAVGFGLPALNDSDELMFQMGAVRMLSQGTLNPGWFGHPATITIYVLALVDMAVFLWGHAASFWASARDFANAIYSDPTWVILPGRIAMVLFSVWAVWLTYRLASALFGRQAGMVAAALIAVSPVNVYWSQVIRSDLMACCFMLLALSAAVRIARDQRWRDHVLFAMWLALATATKWPFALVATALPGALLWAAPVSARMSWRSALGRLAATGAMSVAFLLLISPYLLLDYPTVIRNLHGEAQLHHVGATGGSPFENLAYYLRGPLVDALGLGGLALALGGLVLVARRREARAILLPPLILMLALTCAQNLIWERWALPFLPTLAACAGLAVVRLAKTIRTRWPAVPAMPLVAGTVAVLLVPLVLRSLAQSRERIRDTRQLASTWARAHVPAGSSVLIEHFAFDLAAQPWTIRFPMGDGGCVDAKAMLHGKIAYSTIDAARGTRANVDIGTMPPERLPSCLSDYAIFAEYDRYRAERFRFPQEAASYEAIIRQGRIVASFHPQAGRIGGPVVRIVKRETEAGR